MLLIDAKLTIHHEPNGEHGDWIGLKYGDAWLSNSVLHADWKSEPVAPWACWHCQQAWCCRHGLSRIVKTSRQLVWMTPYYSTQEHAAFEKLSPEQFIADAVVIGRDEWDRLGHDTLGMPLSETFPEITNHDIIQLWLQQRAASARPHERDTFIHHLQCHTIASHPLEILFALSIVQRLLEELQEPPVRMPSGYFQMLPDNAEFFNTLYLDGADFPEFKTTLSEHPHQPVVGNIMYFA